MKKTNFPPIKKSTNVPFIYLIPAQNNSSLNKKQDYKENNKTIAINILDYNIFKEKHSKFPETNSKPA